MTNFDTVKWNTLEQILATDLNRMGSFSAKSLQDTLSTFERGMLDNTPKTCVKYGLNAEVPTTGTLLVNIAAGEALQYDASIVSTFDSQYKIGRLDSQTSIVLTAADATNPRVDLIYGTISLVDADNSALRNILTLPSRVITPTIVFKRKKPVLTLAKLDGIAAISPTLPVVPAGAIPLWYVFVPSVPNQSTFQSHHLMDARVPYNPSAISRSHFREHGMFVRGAGSDSTTVQLIGGRGIINGAIVDLLTAIRNFSATSIFPSGSGSLSASTEYQLYAVGKGSGAPVRKGATDDIVPVLVANNPPLTNGRPTSAITYRPLFGVSDAVLTTTADALYLGSVFTTSASLIQGDGAYPISKDGLASDPVFGMVHGLQSTYWLSQPELKWISTSSLSIPVAVASINGATSLVTTLVGSIPANLKIGDSLATSVWYYVYIRRLLSVSVRGISREVTIVFSTSKPALGGIMSSPETGFAATDYLFAGSVYRNTLGDFEKFTRTGNVVSFVDGALSLHSADVAITPAFTTINAYIPETANEALVFGNALFTPTSAISGKLYLYAALALTEHLSVDFSNGITTQIAKSFSRISIPVRRLGSGIFATFRANRDVLAAGTMGLVIEQTGYLESLVTAQNPLT